MALVLADRVQETCSSPGTGSVSLLGAVSGYQTFSTAIGNGNTCYYTIADQSGSNWEVGIGTYSTSGNSLARTTPLSGSAATPVDFSSGTQNVFVTYPAERAVSTDNTSTLTNKTFTGYTETVYTLGTSGSIALNPSNGTIQTCAAAGTVTFTDSLSAGQSIVLMLTGATTYTINWPTVTWISSTGNTPPVATASMSIVFFKVSTTLYGAFVGSYV